MTKPVPAWRPSVDPPLFPGELLAGPAGLAHIHPDELQRLGAYLRALIELRGPVHVNVAWNALHYGYDLGTRGYSEQLLRVDTFERLDTASAAVVPTGAMVAMASGTPLWAEVVHTEIDDTFFDDDGNLPARRSGAPADAQTTVRVVADPGAFGSLLPEQSAAMARLVRRGRVDAHRHVVSAPLASPQLAAQAGAGDVARFAHWLTADPVRLGGGPVPEVWGSDDPDELAHAVEASLHGLLALAAGTPGVAVVGQHLTGAATARALAVADLRDVVDTMSRPHGRQPRYTGAGVAVRALPADRHLAGPRYVSALVEVTAALHIRALGIEVGAHDGIRLRLDDARRGAGVWRAVLGETPDLAGGVAPLVPLGLGYATRYEPMPLTAEPPEQSPATPPHPQPAPSQRKGDPLAEPWGKYQGGDELAAETAEVGPNDVERGDGLLGDLGIGASHLSFTVALRVCHLAEGVLPVPTAAVEHLAALAGPLAVRLGHPGVVLEDDETFHEPVTLTQAGPHRLVGVTWPLSFYPGLLLTVTLSLGGRIVDVSSELLPGPVRFGDRELAYATDLAILAAFCGQNAPGPDEVAEAAGPYGPAAAPGAALDGDSPQDPGASTLDDGDEALLDPWLGTGGPVAEWGGTASDLGGGTDRAFLSLLLRTVVRAVPTDPDGTRTFIAPTLVATAFAGLPMRADAIWRAARLLDACARRGRLLRLEGMRHYYETRAEQDPPMYVWWPPGQAAPTTRLAPAPHGAEGGLHRAHWVAVSLRQLPAGWAPSPEKVASWPAFRASLGQAYLPRELPPGCTWVEAHERGHYPGWESGAVRVT